MDSEENKQNIIDYKIYADGSNLDSEYAKQLSSYKREFTENIREQVDDRTYYMDT